MLSNYQTKLAYKTKLTYDITLYGFDLLDGQRVEFVAGQYLVLTIPKHENDPVKRMYSIAGPSFQKESFDLIVKHTPGGHATEYLISLNKGDNALFQGPAGVFVHKETPHRKVFLATGTGVAPIRSIILTHFHEEPVTSEDWYLFWGLRTMQDIFFLDELHVIAEKNPNFHFYICLSQESQYDLIQEEDKARIIQGRVNQGVEQVLTDIHKETDYYVCGGAPIVESLRTYLHEHGVLREHILFEKFV
jgi:ferredoxin-NADP reductase